MGTGARQKERVVYLDLARGVAIVLMILQHALIVYAAGQGEPSVLGRLVLLLTSILAAPVFLLIMGVFLGQSQRGVRHGIMRGLRLFGLGYLLNFLRFTLPLMIGRVEGPLPDAAESPLSLLWTIDILQMAGLSFVLLTLTRRALPFRCAWAVIAAGVAVVSPLLQNLGTPWPVLDLLWGAGETVFFPLFPWLIYPLVGMSYGPYLLDADGGAAAMRRTAMLGGILIAAGMLTFVLPQTAIFQVEDYYRTGPGAHLVVLGLIFIWLVLCRLIVRRLPDGGGLRLLYFWSRNVTVAYVAQWVLIGWGILVFGSNRLSSLAAMAVGVGILLLTHMIVKVYRLGTQRKGV